MTATTGFFCATWAMASCSPSPPATLPPGLLIVTISALTLSLSASLVTASTSLRSSVMIPLTVESGEVCPAELHALAAHRHQQRRQHSEHGEAPPEHQATLEPPPVQQEIGFQRHRCQ